MTRQGRALVEAWLLAAIALAGTLFLVPIGCSKAVVTEGSGARTDLCDGILGFQTPVFTSAHPGVLFAAIAVTGILFIEALRRSFRIRSRRDGR